MRTLRTSPLASVALVLALATACADTEALVLESSPSESPTSSEGVPEDIKRVLGRGGTVVEDATFDGGLSAAETLSRFHEDYGTEFEPATVYAVEVTDSDSPGLVVTNARMVHIPDVPAQIEGPAPPPGASPSPEVPILADMFAFYDAANGRMLATEYIAH